MCVGGKRHAPAALYWEPIANEAGWAPEPLWTVGGKLASTGILSPKLPARSKLLYRLKTFIYFLILFLIFYIFIFYVLTRNSDYEHGAFGLYFIVFFFIRILY